ncbi:PIN domain-containing protein [Phyllobacterium endophyticum]|uniref:Twitching motility protein PilT n=1 Tax=Phyllobacterium endophyticum TaxID=1149773 RepID=A0A2P7AUB4_9HYPH|nr:PIN domain-containing protein [Phyllobacterium endophyticum]MBB3234198.1 putative nucleic acid-binding protein [Phyllobacterium endophyticum]PSH57753.1 twitching motility protein PilT [Phyllobacterium endophyticum]TYR43950.1 PIN domain-containing protein [Phyllobacterium endophyticum]
MTAFLDTTILLYSISTAADEVSKRMRAIALTDRDDCVVSVQVLQEFYVQATRVSRTDPLPHELAAGLIKTWLRFRVQDNTVPILQGALEIKRAFGLSYWDSAIISAAREAGCSELFSEDLSHGQIVEGVRIVDPFR